MTTWPPTDLASLGDSHEIRIATERRDGSTRASLPIWVVRVGDELYVRSFRGTAGGWYRHVTEHPHARITAGAADHRITLEPADPAVRAQVDRSFRTKYGRSGPAATMVGDAAAATTLRLIPLAPS